MDIYLPNFVCGHMLGKGKIMNRKALAVGSVLENSTRVPKLYARCLNLPAFVSPVPLLLFLLDKDRVGEFVVE